MADPENGEDAKVSPNWRLLSMVVAPLLYVFSVGPAAALADASGNSQAYQVLKVLYAPLIWLHEHTILARPLEAYVNWWI